jgi:murein DD-endopeptidase MepM/ murein hydrolase activator NlpD
VNTDFSPPPRNAANASRWKPGRTLVLLALAVVAVIAGALAWWQTTATTETRIVPAELTAGPPPVPQPRREVIEGAIRTGDTITALLGEYFTPQQIHELTSTSHKVFPLSGICAGQPFKICVTDGTLERFEYDIDRDAQLIIEPAAAGFDVRKVPIDYTVRTEVVRGTIASSLFESVTAAGESAELAIALADIFAWDIDFIRDIRVGDSFQALVEKRFRDDQPAGYGQILAAEFINQGDTYSAFRFKDGDQPAAYYDAKGNGLRKAFLRAPLAFSRISSGFTLRRFHPITKTWKAHPAIDYAAPTGTPIMAIGDGSIVKIGRTQANGNHIKLRHINGIESLYLHMSRFGKGMKLGKRVAQGQVIGFVGSTGLATGPHLCFRMYKNGGPINPNKLKTAAAAPVSSARLAEYKTMVATLTDRLEGRQTVAQAAVPATGR